MLLFSFFNIYYYHVVGHCVAFCGLKWRFWRAKMYFSPLNCSDCFFVIFFSFYFLSALQKDINSNRVYVLGHKYVLGPSQTHFSPRLAARAKMSLSRAQNIFMPANINSIVIITPYDQDAFLLKHRLDRLIFLHNQKH